MFRLFCFRYTFFLISLVFLNVTAVAEPLNPLITAQGFDITKTQEGFLGQFGQVRVRFEVPDRIAELSVRERSYEVDLAKTPETGHFPLFDLETQVRSLTDVTLNFRNYINEKLNSEGLYTLELQVTDRKGRKASAKLLVQVIVPPPEERLRWNEPVGSIPFRFERHGTSDVSGADEFGIAWKTIKNNAVVIEIVKKGDGASKLVEMTLEDYDDVKTRGQLITKTTDGDDVSYLRLETAGDKAAGAVFGVVNNEKSYLLKVTQSNTSLSKHGTTVTLVGEYKH
ncbi:MAG: hypothetical protein JRE16_10285 [Deltaproteobacteria bacterium]|nr:hypothetical protein [Deltaproteobacteria bacterium]